MWRQVTAKVYYGGLDIAKGVFHLFAEINNKVGRKAYAPYCCASQPEPALFC